MSECHYELYSDIPESLLNHYLEQDEIAVDTELHGLKLYRDEICLIQLSDGDSKVCLVRPDPDQAPQNLKRLMEDSNVLKLFHFALTDVAFLKTSLNIQVQSFCCTRVMSKLVRTYTGKHGLKDLCLELLGVKLEKEQQQSNWAQADLNAEQRQYAANDVLYLVKIYKILLKMIQDRPDLSSGASLLELHRKSQGILPSLIDLLIHGYGDEDMGWETTMFAH